MKENENNHDIFINIFRWLKDLFRLGLKKPLDTQDIYKNLSQHDSARLTEAFNEEWEQEKCRKRPRLLNVIRKIYINKLIGLSFLLSAVDIASRYWDEFLHFHNAFFIILVFSILILSTNCLNVSNFKWILIYFRATQSQCLGGLLTYFSTQSNVKLQEMAIWWAVGLTACAFISSAFTNPFSIYAYQMGMQIRVVCTSLIYRKVI